MLNLKQRKFWSALVRNLKIKRANQWARLLIYIIIISGGLSLGLQKVLISGPSSDWAQANIETESTNAWWKSSGGHQVFYIEYKDLNINTTPNFKTASFFKANEFKSAVQAGLIKVEKVPKLGFMQFLYKDGWDRKLVRLMVNNWLANWVCGFYYSRPASLSSKLEFLKDYLHLEVDPSASAVPANIDKEFKDQYGCTVNEFKTINDIFARTYTKEEVKRRLSAAEVKSTDIVAPATARMRIIEAVDIKQNVPLMYKQIGGKRNVFNVWRLFGQLDNGEGKLKVKEALEEQAAALKTVTNNQNIDEFYRLVDQVLLREVVYTLQGSTMLVSRLAPIDYHHIHFPIQSGKVLNRLEILQKIYQNIKAKNGTHESNLQLLEGTITNLKKIPTELRDKSAPQIHLGGSFISVNTVATTSDALPFSPLTENIRDVLFFDTKVGLMPMVMIGAAGVGKNVIEVKSGEILQMGNDIGHFEFGGSSVITFITKSYETENRVEVIPYPATKLAMQASFEVPSSLSGSSAEVFSIENNNKALVTAAPSSVAAAHTCSVSSSLTSSVSSCVVSSAAVSSASASAVISTSSTGISTSSISLERARSTNSRKVRMLETYVPIFTPLFHIR